MNPYTTEHAAYAKQEELLREANATRGLFRPSRVVAWLRRQSALLASFTTAPRRALPQAEQDSLESPRAV